jgi:hypothetical protein
MSFVPVKGLEQQGLSMLHSARSQLMGQRTQLINAVRGHLSELGIIAERGLLGLAELAAIVRDESDHRLPATARAALMILVRQIEAVSAEIAALDTALRKENKARSWVPGLRRSLGWSGDCQCAQGLGSPTLSFSRTAGTCRRGALSDRSRRPVVVALLPSTRSCSCRRRTPNKAACSNPRPVSCPCVALSQEFCK